MYNIRYYAHIMLLISYIIVRYDKKNPKYIKYEAGFRGIIYNMPKLSNILRGNMQSTKGGASIL